MVEQNERLGITAGSEASTPPCKPPTQRDRILELLRARGPAGATNRELNEIGFRYGGRLHELRRRGYVIRTDRVNEGLFGFVLVGEPRVVGSLHPRPESRSTLPLFPEGGHRETEGAFPR